KRTSRARHKAPAPLSARGPLSRDKDKLLDAPMSTVDLASKIPNNVDLANDPVIRRALESWQPQFLEWWRDMGPSDFEKDDIYLRTAIGVGKGGWATCGHVLVPDYRWGIFLADPEAERTTIKFGDVVGQPVWQQIPGELRNRARRLMVTQADTAPASVEQQRLLGHTSRAYRGTPKPHRSPPRSSSSASSATRRRRSSISGTCSK